jgi:hypothetical protein
MLLETYSTLNTADELRGRLPDFLSIGKNNQIKLTFLWVVPGEH